MGAYPAELAEPGIQYIEAEKQQEVTQVLREEAFWQRYRQRWCPGEMLGEDRRQMKVIPDDYIDVFIDRTSAVS